VKADCAEGIDLPNFHPSMVDSNEDGEPANKLSFKAAQVQVFIHIS